MDNEMIERCSLAACKALGSKYTKDEKYGNYTVVEDRTIDDIGDVIKEIIKAMREPTKKMLSTEGIYTNCYVCGGHKEGWQAMIDAIIND